MKSALRPGEQVVPGHDQLTCYAESHDGITWTRPSLGLFEFKGSKDNNIVCKAYCTLRKEWETFRLDRMLTCHPLTTPDDAEEAA